MVHVVRTMQRSAYSLLIAFVLVAQPVAAGTLEDPEVTDPEGDHDFGVGQDPFNAWDIVSIFFNEEMELCDDAAEVSVVMVLNNIVTGNSGAPGAAFSSSVYFTINDNVYRTYLRPAPNSGPVDDPWIYMYDVTADSDRMVIDGGIDNSGDEKVWWCVPYENLNGAQRGDTVTEIWGRTYLDNWGSTDLAPDGAPDDGEFGREYTLGGVVAAEANLTVGLADNTTVPEATLNEPVTIAMVLSNNATENDTVVLNVTEATEGWEVELEADNVTVAPNATVTVNATMTPRDANATIGEATVQYNSTLGAAGNVTLQARLVAAAGPTGLGGEGNQTAGNSTGDNQTDESGFAIPGPSGGPVILAGILAAAWAAARGRRR